MMKKRTWIRGIAILCAGVMFSGSMQVYAQEYGEQTIYEQKESEQEAVVDVVETENDNQNLDDGEKTEEKIIADETSEDDSDTDVIKTDEAQPETSESDGMEPKDSESDGMESKDSESDGVQLDVSGAGKMQPDVSDTDEAQTDVVVPDEIQMDEIGQDKMQMDVFGENEVQPDVQEQDTVQLDTFVPEKELTLNPQQESEEDGDPQSGVSMSNAEGDAEADLVFSSNAYTGSTYTHNSRYDTGYRIVNGIDVSYYNGTIDWKAVAASGIDYAIIRVGYRGYGAAGNLREDPKFKENIKGALNAGLKVGVYFFSQAISKEEAVEEAEFVLERIAGYNVTLPVVMDFEYASGNKGRLYDAHLSRTRATSVCRNFCETVKSEGYTAMVYANKYMLENAVYADELSEKYKIWLANYTTKTSYAGDYYVWQYTSKGNVKGVNGNVDCDFFYEKEENSVKPPVNLDTGRVRSFVDRMYTVALNRKADANGAAYWTEQLLQGHKDGAAVAKGFIFSKELERRNLSNSQFVDILYSTFLNRTADAAGKAYWTNLLENGVSRACVCRGFCHSGEFTNICNSYGIQRGIIELTENRDQNADITMYVYRCYERVLNRKPDIPGLNFWTGEILAERKNPVEVAVNFVFSTEFKNKKLSNEEYLKVLYRMMFDREYNAPGTDPNGIKFWLNELKSGNRDRYTVFLGFADSQEFRNVLKKFGL